VVYSKGASDKTAIGGLTDGQTYYVIKSGTDKLELARTRAEALAGTQIDLTSAGSGDSHSLTRNEVSFAGTDADVGDDTIDVGDNSGFSDGQAVVYSKGGADDTAIAGLTDGKTYYVIKVGTNRVKLAATKADAAAGKAVDLTAQGSGAGQTLRTITESQTQAY